MKEALILILVAQALVAKVLKHSDYQPFAASVGGKKSTKWQAHHRTVPNFF